MEASQSWLARDIRVPARRVNEICRGKRAITPDTALRLGRFFGTSAELWMNLQKRYDLKRAKDELQAVVAREVRPMGRRAA
jgi:addiction module HigA family antidote